MARLAPQRGDCLLVSRPHSGTAAHSLYRRTGALYDPACVWRRRCPSPWHIGMIRGDA